jgi:hypothetical protein
MYIIITGVCGTITTSIVKRLYIRTKKKQKKTKKKKPTMQLNKHIHTRKEKLNETETNKTTK